MDSPLRSASLLAAAVLTLGAAACASDTSSSAGDTTATTAAAPVIDPGDGGDYHPSIDPADFSTTVDNRYFPLAPGSRWVYEGESADGPERDVVEVTQAHKQVMGIDAVVVRDTVSDGAGQVLEATDDWYAQDGDGNVWYLGEASTEYEDGRPSSTGGSWEAGVDGAQPGILMPADPAIGDAYRQEFAAGEAEDMGEVLGVDLRHSVPLARYDHVLQTREWSPLEPDVIEEKFYAPGVGCIAERSVAGEPDHTELVRFDPGS